jgi:beta-lysine 5,6-aminomutase beta subunit
VKAYGDTRDDGMVQISFTLPIVSGPKAREAGRAYAEALGLQEVRLACAKPAGDGFTFYVVYGKSPVEIDPDAIAGSDRGESMSREEVDAFLKEKLGRRAVVVGATLGSDAHTVGIDAIMNMKGFAGDYGLERYEMMEAHNLGAQVEPEELVRRAEELKADAILVSQVVTQKDIHVTQLTKLVEAEGLREKTLMIAGGPSIDDRLAQELGYDAGFGWGTMPRDVATFIARRLAKGTS